VTLVFAGKLAHRDSAGNSGVIGPGDVQWMTAASGILHEEFHEKEFAAAGGVLHSVQLWVNLPAKHKMEAPRYQTLLNDQIQQVELDDLGSRVRVIAGEYQGVQGRALTWSPVTLLDLSLQAGSRFKLELPQDYNLSVLLISGQAELNGQQAGQQELLVFNHDGTELEILAERESQLLILGGEPIREPVASYGPFVMNTKAQLLEAIEDFQSGRFGTLV
jgi:redox-sensitive bicupin YhaK (pirin superfamily)